MRPLRLLALTTCAAATVLAGCASSSSGGGAGNPMTFFVTSSNPGQGGNLGGLAGADAYCQKLASNAGAGDSTCGNWTSGTTGSAIVGHHDRIGLNESAPMKSWNHSHPSKACDMAALKSTGGDGRMYCFATN